jgi:FkbM family methyltransferase
VGTGSASFNVRSKQELYRITGIYGGARPNLPELIEDVKSDDTFFDIGANIGVYSCLIGNELTEGTVVAFEPFPANIDRLRAHLTANNINHLVREEALSNERGEIELVIEGAGPGSGCHSIAPNKKGKSIRVPMESIDSLINRGEVPVPNVIQMDAEGVEYDVLEGAKQTIKRSECRLLHIQVHCDVQTGNQLSDFDADLDSLVDFVEECGFQKIDLKWFENSPNGYLVAKK